MTILLLEIPPLWSDARFHCLFSAEGVAFTRSASRFMRTGHTTPSCGSHALQRDKTADVVGEVLEADFGFRPRDADRPYDPTTRGGLLSTEYVLDANPNPALFAVCVLLRLR